MRFGIGLNFATRNIVLYVFLGRKVWKWRYKNSRLNFRSKDSFHGVIWHRSQGLEIT